LTPQLNSQKFCCQICTSQKALEEKEEKNEGIEGIGDMFSG